MWSQKHYLQQKEHRLVQIQNLWIANIKDIYKKNKTNGNKDIMRWLILHLCVVNIFQVEIEVMEDGAIEVETGLEEVVNTAKSSEEGSDDSALALLADITSKYQHGESTLHIIKKDCIDEVCWGLLLGALHFGNADIA